MPSSRLLLTCNCNNRLSRFRHNAILIQNLPAPVRRLFRTIVTHHNRSIVLSVPERAASKHAKICPQLCLEENFPCIITDMVHRSRLDGPLADEDRVDSRRVGLGKIACAVGSIIAILLALEEIDVRVPDNVDFGLRPPLFPYLRA